MARTRVERRIRGELIAIEMSIAVIEAIADIEPALATALGRVSLGDYSLVRAIVIEGMKAAGDKRDVGAWWDKAVETSGLQPLQEMAHAGFTDALVKQGDAVKNLDAAVKTEAETAGSTSASTSPPPEPSAGRQTSSEAAA